MRKFAVMLALWVALCGCGGKDAGQAEAPPPAPPPAGTQVPGQTAVAGARRGDPTPTPSPTPTPTPEAREPYDFTQPVPEGEAVEEDYFADACFIGDSRTNGFQLYSGISQGDFIFHTGLKVFDIDTKEISYNGEKIKVLDALAQKEYGKVYVCLGLNELGIYDDQGYYDCFAKLVDDIRAIQPEAVVYLQLIIPVNIRKCAETGQRDYVENGHLGVFNDLLRQVAADKRTPFLDPAEAIVDETGEPPYEMCGDGVHFNREGYRAWYEYLKTHTIEKGELE